MPEHQLRTLPDKNQQPDLNKTGPDAETVADHLLRWTAVGAALAGWTNITGWSWLPMSAIWYTLVLLIIVSTILAPHIGAVEYRPTLTILALAFIGWRAAAGVLGSTLVAFPDWIQAHKAFIFLIVIGFFVGRRCFTGPALARTMKLLLPITLIDYIVTTVSTDAGGGRGAIWTENNFELMTIIGLTYLAWPHLGRNRAWWMVLLGVIVIGLSGSRSSIAEYGVMLAVLLWKPRDPKFLLYLASGVVVFWASGRAFAERSTGKRSDRELFFEVFRHETYDFTVIQWLFGQPVLTPLNFSSCETLSAWSGLFSSVHSGQCYSVILHMYSARLVLDFGIAGGIFLIVFLWAALGQSGASARERLALIGIASANALSVSSFNSEYMLIPLIVAAGMSYRDSPEVVSSQPRSFKRRVLGDRQNQTVTNSVTGRGEVLGNKWRLTP
ncbi:hypothetical protein [Kineosporia babensis]|uniref:Uncharacterized protein n=1 Tax=Kineosporia babensis TaxID=499548 RepID=A0A9X1NCK0_9ACTN|nr:hypothetical protein [Kineosporia babensis]MCD5312722.1 hypothetical protein [Kineosporia babensis]